MDLRGAVAPAQPDAVPAAEVERTVLEDEGGDYEPEPVFKLHDLVSFRVRDAKVMLEQPSDGAQVEFPARLLPVLMCFATPAPLSDAFLARGAEDGPQLAESFAILRDLIAGGVVVPQERQEASSGVQGAVSPEDIWSDWGPSLTYYLGSRTSASHSYFQGHEQKAWLQDKATRVPRPSSFKDYPAAPFTPCERPEDVLSNRRRGKSFVDVLLQRRTTRHFAKAPMSGQHLSTLLYLTWGAIHRVPSPIGDHTFLEKSSPSGGSLHSAEVYPVVMRVDGLSPGVYHYSVRRHGLELVSDQDPQSWIGAACGGQDWVAEAPVVFLTTSVLRRMSWKYRSARALRVVLQDVGHLSQTFCLVATWLDLGSFTTGALRDEIFEQAVGLDFLHEPVLLVNGAGVASSNR
jgi:SagB-type dehydrogenase family enzyme